MVFDGWLTYGYIFLLPEVELLKQWCPTDLIIIFIAPGSESEPVDGCQ
jgi:hypothetical protein